MPFLFCLVWRREREGFQRSAPELLEAPWEYLLRVKFFMSATGTGLLLPFSMPLVARSDHVDDAT